VVVREADGVGGQLDGSAVGVERGLEVLNLDGRVVVADLRNDLKMNSTSDAVKNGGVRVAPKRIIDEFKRLAKVPATGSREGLLLFYADVNLLIGWRWGFGAGAVLDTSHILGGSLILNDLKRVDCVRLKIDYV
jgi:hypothetical protein